MSSPKSFADRLVLDRRDYAYAPAFREWASGFGDSALGLLFPHYAVQPVKDSVIGEIDRLKTHLQGGLAALPGSPPAEATANAFIAGLENIYDTLRKDAQALLDNDPAANSLDQILFAYPGFYATAIYRLAHSLHLLGVPLLPRMMGEDAHSRVGIDIHPEAKIGRAFSIDHGTGVVIGETAVIGDRVKLYQGVTLGAVQVHKRLAGMKRHPTVEDDVVVYANATILGDIVVGKGSVIGGNTWVTASVPAHSVVTNRTTVRPNIEAPDFAI